MALEKIGAFWKGKPGSKAVLTGSIEVGGKKYRALVFRNEDKKGDKHPDYRVMTDPDEVTEAGQKGRAKPAADKPIADDFLSDDSDAPF